ncbi:undecaprenyl-diphosphate phosphatase [Pseudomonas sp. D1-3]
MDWLHLLVLSLIQGVTEFIPVSSSAHLILPSQLLGWPDQGQAFDVAVHVGTLTAVVLAFRQQIAAIVSGWLGHVLYRRASPESRMGWMIILATIPAAVAGLVFESLIEQYTRSMLVIGTTTIVFGLVLWWADMNGSRDADMSRMTWRHALLIGLAQMIALIPGTSRSGITMTAALMLGFDRKSAASFSFLMSIPLILAAGSLKALHLVEQGDGAHWGDMAWGIGLSFISAFLCIKLFLAALDRIGMLPYVIYRLILGTFLLFVAL